MYSYMPATSYLGRSVPGGRESSARAADPGKGVGRGVAGNANMPFAATALLPPAALSEAAFFSAFAAAFLVSPSVPPLFCRAHSGKAKSALIANAAHQLRISLLPSFLSRNPPVYAPACRLLAAFGWPHWTHFNSSPCCFSSCARISLRPCPYQGRNLKKQQGAAQLGYSTFRSPCTYFRGFGYVSALPSHSFPPRA